MSHSPRLPLRRSKTENELLKTKLSKIQSRSEQLSRRRHPDREAKRMLQDLDSLPRPRSPSLAAAYLNTLEKVGNSARDCDAQIAHLTQKPDLQKDIEQALKHQSLRPLLKWPEHLWNKRAFKKLVFDEEGRLRDCTLLVTLMALWLKDQEADTYFREDRSSKRLLRYLAQKLDRWMPDPTRKGDLFKQCVSHCVELLCGTAPNALTQILKRLCEVVPKLTAMTLFTSLMLCHYVPLALDCGFDTAAQKDAMLKCQNPPKENKRALAVICLFLTPGLKKPNTSSEKTESES